MPGPLRPGDEWPGHYQDQTIVVTGASGYLGRRMVERLAEVSCRIVCVSRTEMRPAAMPSAATVVNATGDLRDPAFWTRVLDGASLVIHFAGQTSAAVAEADPKADFEANVVPMRRLLHACRELRQRPTILFAGTVTQAGVPSRLPVDEDAEDLPVTVYDQHKLTAERELEAAVAAGAATGATLRLVNIYGPGPATTADRHVLNRMIRAALRGEALTAFGAGDYVRDYLFVDDAVDAFLAAGAHADRISGRHYVVGSGKGVTIREAFELVAARAGVVTGRVVPVVTIEPPRPLSALEQRSFTANPARFFAATGWRSRWTLGDGIDRTIEAASCE